jgi:sugar (pentulose or hexulose) kinase
MFGSLEEAVDRMVVVKERLEPNPERRLLYDDVYARYRDLYDDLSGMFDRG